MKEIFEVTDADCAFPTARNIPPKEEIPREFWNGHTIWNECFNDWFYSGIRAEQLIPKEGVDKNKAIRAIKSIIGSWEPKHEHKEAAVAYLLSEWFERYDRDEKKPV
jgi:hypothetical protein